MSVETEALSRIPGHDQAAVVRRAAGITSLPPAHLPAVPYMAEEPAARAAVEEATRRLLTAGKPVPEDIAQPIVDAQQRDVLGRLRSEAMSSIVRKTTNRIADMQPATVNPALAYLREQLEEISEQVTSFAAVVGDIRTADDAIARDAVSEWKGLGGLAIRYAEIRRVQMSLYRQALTNTTHPFKADEFERSALFADALSWHPTWVSGRTEYAPREPGSGPLAQAVRDYVVWMRSDLTESDVLNGLEAPERRLVIAFTKHRPWIPTIEQWRAVDDLAQRVTRIPSQESIAEVEHARQQLLRITETDTKLPDPNRLPFQEEQATYRHSNVAAAGLSISQLRDISEDRRSADQAADFLKSLAGRGGVPTE